jgi:hypothetical protein
MGIRMAEDDRKGQQYPNGIAKFLEILNGPFSDVKIMAIYQCRTLTLEVMLAPLVEMLFSEQETTGDAFHALMHYHTEEALLPLINALHLYSSPPMASTVVLRATVAHVCAKPCWSALHRVIWPLAWKNF